MKKIIFLLSLFFGLATCNAQVSNEEDLKRFYTEYLSHFVSDGIKTDSIVKNYCTKEFYKEWNEIVNEKGLYDPFTNGIFDDEDLMKSTLVVRKNGEGYAPALMPWLAVELTYRLMPLSNTMLLLP